MIETLAVAVAVLWCLVIVLALMVFALARQVGVLHERVAPAGALQPTSGPRVGEPTAAERHVDLDGREVVVGGPAGDARPTLVLWVSPTCPVCRALVPTAVSMATAERLRLVFASDGDTAESHRAYAAELGIGRFPYVVSQTLGLRYAVSKLPFAVLIGADGLLKSKGLVNTREHLESLVEAMETGIATLQDYVRIAEPAAPGTAKEHAT
jgi:methylamine dehydrogenase accessory protein MauD